MSPWVDWKSIKFSLMIPGIIGPTVFDSPFGIRCVRQMINICGLGLPCSDQDAGSRFLCNLDAAWRLNMANTSCRITGEEGEIVLTFHVN